MDKQTNRWLLSINDTRAALGGVGRSTVEKLVNQGELVRVKVGRRAMITSESLTAYLDRITA